MSEDGAACCKVVLLGESGVGKTCIITRYINNTFDDNGMSTTGASYVGKSMSFDEYGGKSIKFDIWDTAGQEKYRALTKIFYKDASIAILVYDITRKESFDELKNYWYNQIRDYAPKNTIVAIAANKSDLFEKEQVDTTDLISLGELENFEDKNGNGTYKATTGHDDLIMTFVQIPMVQQTSKYKSMMEEYIEATVEESYNNKWASNQNWDYFGSQVSNPMQENIFTNRLGSYVPQQGGMYDIFDPTRNSNSIF